MTERLNTEDCISKVYQFLSDYKGNWKTDADTNGDDTIIQTEFRGFMIKNQSGWNEKWHGEWKYDSEDIINKFWKSINSETTGFANVKGTSNKIALDDKEIKNMEKNVIITDSVREFVSKKSVPDQSWSTQLANSWKESIKASLSNKVRAHFQGVDFSTMTEEQLKNDINAFLQENGEQLYKDSERITTADIYKQLAIENAGEKVKKFEKYGYNANSDPDLNSLIENYVQSIKDNPNVTLDEMQKAIETLVNDYLLSAGLGDSSKTGNNVTFRDNNGNSTTYTNRADRLNRYSNNSSGLNGLQTAVLTEGFTEAIIGKITAAGSEYKALYEDAAQKAIIDAEIKTYVKTKIQENDDKTFEEIQKLYDSVAQEFIDVNMKNIKTKKDTDELEAKKAEAKNTVKTYYDKGGEYAAAVKEIFGDDYNATIDACKTPKDVDDLVTKLEDKIAEIDKAAKLKAQYADSFKSFAGLIDDLITDKLSTMMNGYSEIHTEFGMNSKGDIVFQNTETDNVFKAIKKTVKDEFSSKYPEEYKAIGESTFDRLVQAAWIMAYNTFNSSQRNNCSSFVAAVLNNLQSIFEKLSTNTEYLEVFKSDTAYTNTKLTAGLTHYNTNTTLGNDEKINYESYTRDENGVHLTTCDQADYDVTMSTLLKRILKTAPYSSIDPNIVKSVFYEAQEQAIKTLQDNIYDCPYGTGRNGGRVENVTKDWSGQDNREGDHFIIDMDQLVQITLYYFDKLLYAKLAE